MDYEQLLSLDEQFGLVSKGLASELVEQLMVEQYELPSDLTQSQAIRLREHCLVCLEDYQSSDQLKILPCSHRFHKACINPWLSHQKHCPVCRKEIDALAIALHRSQYLL